VLAIGRADEYEFPVDGIAEREAFLFGDADERVEEELGREPENWSLQASPPSWVL